MKKKALVIIVFLLIVFAFQTTTENLFVVPSKWPKPKYDFNKNPLTKEKVELGRALFYDPILSKDSTISCASCHSQFTAFTHVDHALSHGINDRIGNRNSPALMNLAWQNKFMWDGAVNHLDVQALAPISNHLEMDEKIENVVKKLQRNNLYKKLFKSAFNDSLATGEYTLKAISQFMLSLVSSNAKYDSVMLGKAKFTEQEKKGYVLFKKNCSACHTEPLFTNVSFENNGLPVDTILNDIGRMGITHDPNDSLKFKVPTLRNVEFSQPYMHDGRFKKLSEVVKHYVFGVKKTNTLSSHLNIPIMLKPSEQVDLIAFLHTLTDKKFLFDQKHSYPKKLFSP